MRIWYLINNFEDIAMQHTVEGLSAAKLITLAPHPKAMGFASLSPSYGLLARDCFASLAMTAKWIALASSEATKQSRSEGRAASHTFSTFHIR
jgi:hypothetical protein